VGELLTYPTWEKYTVLSYYVGKLSIRDRRLIFHTARSCGDVSPDLFFPAYGFTFAEFAVWHTLRRERSASTRTTRPG